MNTKRLAPRQNITKSPSFWTVTLGGTALLVMPFLIPSHPLISIKADDLSISSVNAYQTLIETHCQTRINHLEEGDTLVDIQFADYAEVTREEKITNAFKIREYCNKKQQDIHPINKNSGTSLTLVLERIISEIKVLRQQGNQQPVVITLILQAAEPVNQTPLDFTTVKRLIAEITEDRGFVTIIGTTEQLQTDLAQLRQGVSNFQICPASNLSTCVEEVYLTARNYQNGGQ